MAPDTDQQSTHAGIVGSRAHTPSLAAAGAGDVAVVLVFVAMGRNTHDEGLSVASVLGVAAPFLLALAVAWAASLVLAQRVGGDSPRAAGPSMVRVWPTGVGLWVGTAVGGLVLRNLAFGDGTATSFVIVACAVLGAGLVGWRAALAAWTAHRR